MDFFWLPKDVIIPSGDFRLGPWVGIKVIQVGRFLIARDVTNSFRKMDNDAFRKARIGWGRNRL